MGGNAFKDVGAINQIEVRYTLDALHEQLNLSYPHCALGSTGKKMFNGDLDIGVQIPKDERQDFFKFLKSHFGDHDVRSYGAIYSIKYPIAGYRYCDTDLKRTGLVQVDFIMHDDIEFLKFFYYSPLAKDSKLKGTHRNISISTLAGFTDRIEDTYLDGFDRPISIHRYKWSPSIGFCRVHRTSRRNDKTGKWIKKQDEVVLEYTDNKPETVANILFKGKLGVEYLDTCEKVIEAVNILYKDDPKYKERIFTQMAWDLQHNHNIGNKGWDYPEEVAKYMEE